MTPLRVYVASHVRHLEMWKRLRTEWTKVGINIRAQWLDAVNAPDSVQTLNYIKKSWERNFVEFLTTDIGLVYAEEGDTLRGALVEAGGLIAWEVPVIACGFGIGRLDSAFGTWQFHPLVKQLPGLEEAHTEMLRMVQSG